ncbi:SDR family NAD(P)-dependent oxidoreductase [Rhodococcus wratislaviensis]|uniref:Putative oxidoreductase n=1 Tax=Rhodococcus wratislaviensis NBRC 100605 TaxID=1219028 RepID=X0Q0T1_RHOWR|nr:glucose 1-dehydrogenase [Rhodococcus wratislaviensis]GAF49548.1 putative oxidoreductase [Rhodococcus wratislaviensis NBRC 100605]
MTRLQGLTALVTGAGSGMGAETARRFVAEGAAVLITDINREAGEEIAAPLGEKARFQHLDVARAESWAEAVQACIDTFGSLDVLVNNAGVIAWGGITTTPEHTFRTALDVNTVGPFLGMQAVVPHMVGRGSGSIINVCSTSSLVGSPKSVAYTASKWATRGMTKAVALELASTGVRVNSIHPGVIDTPMSTKARSGAAGDLTSGTPPVGRLGATSEIAALAVHLASAESAFITGADHVIDGGRSAGW